tara:strand:- start:497 stop:748 length:252 start_codon:yes stop_codon:yes gene_type:complete
MEESCAAANDEREIEASVGKSRQRCMWDILNLQKRFPIGQATWMRLQHSEWRAVELVHSESGTFKLNKEKAGIKREMMICNQS